MGLLFNVREQREQSAVPLQDNMYFFVISIDAQEIQIFILIIDQMSKFYVNVLNMNNNNNRIHRQLLLVVHDKILVQFV